MVDAAACAFSGCWVVGTRVAREYVGGWFLVTVESVERGDGWPSQSTIDRVIPLLGEGAPYDAVVAAAIVWEVVRDAVWERSLHYTFDNPPEWSMSDEVAASVDTFLERGFGPVLPVGYYPIVRWYRRICLVLRRTVLASGGRIVGEAIPPENEFPFVWDAAVSRCESVGVYSVSWD